MGLTKVPLFAWSMLVAGSVWVLTLPVAIANIAILYIDLSGGAGSSSAHPTPASTCTPSWHGFSTSPPCAAAVPVLGIAGSIIPVVAKGRQVSHEAMMILIGLAGLLAIGGWSQPFFGDERDTLVYIAFGVAALVPVLASLGGNGATLVAGEAPLGIPPAHMIGALGSMLLFLAATAAGALRVIDPLDLIGTTADTGCSTSLRSPPFSERSAAGGSGPRRPTVASSPGSRGLAP